MRVPVLEFLVVHLQLPTCDAISWGVKYLNCVIDNFRELRNELATGYLEDKKPGSEPGAARIGQSN